MDKNVPKVAGVWKQPRGGANQPKVSQQAEAILKKLQRQHDAKFPKK